MNWNKVSDYYHIFHYRLDKISSKLKINKLIMRLYFKFYPSYKQKIGRSEFKLGISSSYEASKVRTLDNEKKILEDVVRRSRPNDIFFDVGANIGLYSCCIGKVLDSGSVVAFEPHSKSRERLIKNLRRNNIKSIVTSVALGDSSDTMSIISANDSVGTGKISLKDHDDDGDTVKIIPGDELVDKGKVPKPTIIKIDVEGAELSVLKGLKKTLANKNCRLIYCEIHPEGTMTHAKGLTDDEIDELYCLLSESGFKIEQIGQRNDKLFIFAQK